MNCTSCGAEVSANARFCPQCGKTIEKKAPSGKHTLQLECRDCGGRLVVDSDRQVLVCPFCQSMELMVESDEVVIQRIKTNAYKEVEMEKLRYEATIEQEKEKHKQEEEAKKAAYTGKHGKIAKLCLLLSFATFGRFIHFLSSVPFMLHLGGVLLTAVQTACFLYAFYIGRRNGYKKCSDRFKLFAVAGFLCFIAWAVV